MTAYDNSSTVTNASLVEVRNGFSGQNCFVVSNPKCGTTAWPNYLSYHPDIFLPRSKEPHFFNTDQPRCRWSHSWQNYFDHYKDYHGGKVVLDASVQYRYSTEAAQNIAGFNPRARIVIMLRRPSDFIRSYHNQLLMKLDESNEDLHKAREASGHCSVDDIPSVLDYKRAGRFSEQVARYLKVFDRSQIIVVIMDDWMKEPRALYLRMKDFLRGEDSGGTDLPPGYAAKHVSRQTLHRLTQRPLDLLKSATRLIKSLLGMGHIQPVRLQRWTNNRAGYRSASDDAALAREINAYFAPDRERLRKLLDIG